MLFAYWPILIVGLLTRTHAGGVGKAWEVSPVQKPDYPSALSPWPRLESSAFEVRSISGVGRLSPPDVHHDPIESETQSEETKEFSQPAEDRMPEALSTLPTPQSRENRELEDMGGSDVFISAGLLHDPMVDQFFSKTKGVEDVEAVPSLWQKFRRQSRTGRNHGPCSEVEEIDQPDVEELPDFSEERRRLRRATETEMEKIAASKNVREGRLSSPESWSTQPLSVEFRHPTELERVASDEEKSARSTSQRGLQAPHTDFITANRRSYSESRESRDMPMPAGRSLDEVPIYRNTLRDRDLDAPYSRGLFYPERYRTERDYFVRGITEPTYPQDRYREVDFDFYGRSRPMPKPKRIIYYATLPEVVRKPVDLRSYPRPYDMLTRTTGNVMGHDGFYKRRTGTIDPGRYRYNSYPSENYDVYAKRPVWNERPYIPYPDRMNDVHRREQDMDHASMKDASRTEESMLELSHDRKMPDDRMNTRDQEKIPWPVKIGTEISVKESERISGRKVFGQRDDYNRFRNNARMDRGRESTGSGENRN